MGHRTTLSGHIQELYYSGATTKQKRLIGEWNRRIINSLPINDEWPILPRGLFSFSPNLSWGSRFENKIRPTYRGRVIYFGGSFSSIFYEWEEWLEKFENLLSRLYWEHATVVLVTECMGNHTYHWKANRSEVHFDGEHFPPPVESWEFSGGPRKF